jgi:hypothetical protein
MKKSLPATTFVAFPLSAKATRLKAYGCIAIVLLAGCTATQVRWDATNMREQVMVYYNDQIMDNLIRAKRHLPFVHVDITLLTSTGASQISGTIGAGETRTHTDGLIGAVNSITKAVTRPFSYSVTPQQTETLSIVAAPALGGQAIASLSPPSKMEVTKITETREKSEPGEPEKPLEKITTERTPIKPANTIYKLYEDFAACYVKDSPIRPSKDEYVPGTLKRWGEQYYYIPVVKDNDNQLAYYNFCKKLFTKGQAGSLEKTLQQVQSSAALPTR